MKIFFLEFVESLKIALFSIKANKMRSVLTMLGIVVGIVSVTLMGATLYGLRSSFNQKFENLGTDVLYVQKYPFIVTSDWSLIKNRRDITLAHAKLIERKSEFARLINPQKYTSTSVKHGQKSIEFVTIMGTGEQLLSFGNSNLELGRFFTKQEADQAYHVCVIGSQVALNLFPAENPINKKIQIGGFTYKVIGVFENQGGGFGPSYDNMICIPILRFFLEFQSRRSGITIAVKSNLNQIDETIDEIRSIVRNARGLKPWQPDDFAINQISVFLELFNKIGGIIGIVGFSITGLSLFVGGIGIMNIMFVSVTERTKEIGLRKAVGAPKRSILMQFLIESSLLCLFGGIVGIVLSYPLTLIIDTMLPTEMPMILVAIALIISIMIGVISGFIPAYKAAKMNAVDALRYE